MKRTTETVQRVIYHLSKRELVTAVADYVRDHEYEPGRCGLVGDEFTVEVMPDGVVYAISVYHTPEPSK